MSINYNILNKIYEIIKKRKNYCFVDEEYQITIIEAKNELEAYKYIFKTDYRARINFINDLIHNGYIKNKEEYDNNEEKYILRMMEGLSDNFESTFGTLEEVYIEKIE